MYNRLINLYDIEKLSNKNILLVGVGGVGSSAFEVLIRSGIKNITIVDFDTYEESNLNRQIHSNLNNIGKKKVSVLYNYAKSINPLINTQIIPEFINKNSDIDFTKYDFVLDAVDSIEAKVLLITKCHELGIPIISSLGVGNRLIPSDLSVTKLSKVTGDPLGKKLRYELKNNGFLNDTMVVASKELPVKSNPVNSYIGVSCYAGILLADYALKELLNGN